eukprot:7606037-Pyramimonas_sp.AAC.1
MLRAFYVTALWGALVFRACCVNARCWEPWCYLATLGLLGPFWDPLGPSLGPLGPSWGVLEAFDRLGALMGPSWGLLGSLVGSSWGSLGA